MALHEANRGTCHQCTIDLSSDEHVAERAVVVSCESHALGQIDLDLLGASGLIRAGLAPFDVGELDAVLIVEPPAHIDGSSVRPFGRANPSSLEVFRRNNPALL